MMSDFESLLNAIPSNSNVAFILADYLEERGDPRCELLRILYTLKDTIELTPERFEMEERLRELVLVEGLEPVAPRYTNEIGMEFVWIPPGEFWMGSPVDEPEREPYESRHEVTLTRGCWMQTTAVTQGQWEGVMDSNPSQFQRGDAFPVESVSWEDAQRFCQTVTEWTQRETLLPTEAQWEYACRAGTTTPFWFGPYLTTDDANFDGQTPSVLGHGEAREVTVPVRTFLPNAFGLFEMHGNVTEWCRDARRIYKYRPKIDPVGSLGGPTRALRGGSWYYNAQRIRSAYRRVSMVDRVLGSIGFRCVQV